jgi:glycosyltransferase domain-containing protein
MEETMLSKLTLIIPTCGRQKYALRNMRYWSGKGATVLVMDGSDSPIPPEDMVGIESNVQYHHKISSIQERLKQASSYISTEYAMLCGDDEFQTHSGLIACTEFLENNEEYTSCCGRCIGFRVEKDRVELFPEKENHASHFVDQASIGDRVKYHIGNYMVTTIYGVHRQESFKLCLSGISRSCSCIYVAETIFELISAVSGKSIVLPNATWLRSYENKPIQTELTDRKYRISSWYDDPLKVMEVDSVYQDIKRLLNSIDDVSDRGDVWEAACCALKLRINADRASIQPINLKRPLVKRVGLSISKQTPQAVKFFIKRIMTLLNIEKERCYYVNGRDYSYKELEKKFNILLNEKEINAIMEGVLLFHGGGR